MKTIDKLIVPVAVPFPQFRPRGRWSEETLDLRVKVSLSSDQLAIITRAMEAVGIVTASEFIRLAAMNLSTAILKEAQDDGKSHA